MTYTLPQLPKMRCDAGCGECCGVVPVGHREFERLRVVVERRGITPVQQDETCPLFINGQCAAYEARPLVCRIYGHEDVEACTCPRGYNANADARTLAPWKKAMRKEVRGGRRWIHELAFTAAELVPLASRLIATTVRQGRSVEEAVLMIPHTVLEAAQALGGSR